MFYTTLLVYNLLLLGDFNIHLDKQDAPDTIIFQDFLDSFGLINHVKQSTHTSSHILDLVISQPEFCQTVRTVELGHYLSDHCFTHVSLLVDRPIPARRNIKYQKIKSIDHNAFSLHLSEAFNTQPEPHMDRVSQYNTELRNALKKYAPEKSKFIRDTHQQPWFSDEIKGEIVLRRKMERIWKREKEPLKHGKTFILNIDRWQTSLRKHNAVTTNRLLKNTSMTIKLSLTLQMEYFLGNKNQLYHQQDLFLY